MAKTYRVYFKGNNGEKKSFTTGLSYDKAVAMAEMEKSLAIEELDGEYVVEEEMERDLAFGRLLAIANVLSERVFEKGRPWVAPKHWSHFERMPAKTFEKMHAELMEYADKFGEEELHLMGMFEEIMSSLGTEGYSNEPLNEIFVHGYHSKQHELHNLIGSDEAAELWGLSSSHVKDLCAQGKVAAVKIGNRWIIDKRQPNPKTIDEVGND